MANFADLITFSRASVGWYFNSSGNLVQAAIDEPRFDYTAIAGRQPGLLIEPAATEANPRTTITTSVVSGTGSLTATDLTLSVFGVFPGVLCTGAGVGSNVARVTNNINGFSVVNGITRTIEVYYRVGTSPNYLLNLFNATNSNTSTMSGVIGAPSVFTSAAGTITFVSDQICSDGLTRRLRVLFTPNADGIIRIGFGPNSTVVGQTITFVTYFTRVGSVFSSPILTNGSAVTRSADVASVSQASVWFNNSNGTLFGDFRVSYSDNSLPAEVQLCRINSGAYNSLGHSVYLGTSSPDTGRPTYRLETASGVTTVEGAAGAYSPNSDVSIKSAITYSSTTASFCFDGGTVYSGIPTGSLPDMTAYNMVLGGAAPITIMNLNYKPATSSNSELQALTA